MTTSAIQQTSNLAAQVYGRAATTAFAALSWVAVRHRRRTTRRQLETLSLEQLRDVGIDPDVISRGHRIPTDPWVNSRLMSLM